MKVVKEQTVLSVSIPADGDWDDRAMQIRVDSDDSVLIVPEGEAPTAGAGFWLYNKEIDAMIKLLQAAKKEINA